MSSPTPLTAPPAYTRINPKSTGYDPGPSHRLETRNGITPQQRRSMEDERRPLPSGWVRQFDANTNHQFFVDTTRNPPQSIWHHPYDDKEYLATLPAAERENIQMLTRHSSIHDIVAEDSDIDDESHHTGKSSGHPTAHPAADKPGKVHQWGRKMKDTVTHTTHEEREQQRRQREEQERQAHEQYIAFRGAMQKAMQTGQPQFLGKDANGKDVFVEAPDTSMSYGYNQGYGNNHGEGYMQNRLNGNARYIRPSMPYSRPYGYGYGGGYGMPLLGGLGGGLLLGGMLGGMGGGGF